jgi:hypothetical protein
LEEGRREIGERSGRRYRIGSGEGNADWIKDLPEGPPFPLDGDAVVAVFLQKTPKKKKRVH